MEKIKNYKLKNILKTYFLITLVMFLVAALVYFVLSVFSNLDFIIALFFAIFSSIVYILFGTLFGPKLILISVGARPLKELPDYERVKRIIEELCKKVKIKEPELYYFKSEDINAFATGLFKNKSVIAITTGALKYLNDEELAGVLGHEISHIKNRDTLYMTITSVLVGFISFLANMLVYSFFFDSRRRPTGVYILSILISILIPIIATIIRLAISREREYLADLDSAEMNGNPNGLISVFKKIMRINRGEIPYNEAIEPLYFVSIEELFSTHPPIEKRIEKLQKAFR